MPVSIVVPAGGGGSNPFGDTIDLSEMSTIATARMLGNISGGNAVPSALTLAQVLGFLGTGTPGSGNYLRGDGSWQAISGGKIAQFVPNFSGAVQTGSGVIPYDDSYPQNNEGSEYYTVAITPTNAGSTLFLLVILHLSSNSASTGTAALFVDSTADAIAAFPYFLDAAECVIGFFVVAASNTSERTYRLRAGQISASTLTVNGSGGSRRYGGSARSGIIAIEVLP